MRHDLDLLDRLSALAPVRYDGPAFRATRQGLDPLAASVAGGRWMVPDEAPTLYTSCERDGALAEIVHHWSMLTPAPRKPVVLHRLSLRTSKLLQLGRAELIGLGVDWRSYGETRSAVTQRIGAAIAFLEFDGLIAPSARWNCDNIMLFPNNHDDDATVVALEASEEVDWQQWAKDHSVSSSE